MSDTCIACGVDALDPVYRADGSARGLTVHLCTVCALVQSWPRIDRWPERTARVSAGADWGNVRYGKGFRTAAHIASLEAAFADTPPRRILDVGSSRGSFVSTALALWPDAEITAVEPDSRFATGYPDDPRVRLLADRIERLSLPQAGFDLIYSCHTHEHLADPQAVLQDHRRCLSEQGRLLIEVPNIAFLDAGDVIEEWFIDKHLTHYSVETLARGLAAAGLAIEARLYTNDAANLAFLCRRGRQAQIEPATVAEVRAARERISAYAGRLSGNRRSLRAVVAALEPALADGLSVWGAGRILNALVENGGLAPERLAALIDVHLRAHVPTLYGHRLAGPEALPTLKGRAILIASRAFAHEISRTIESVRPDLEILHFADLLNEAKTAAAAA